MRDRAQAIWQAAVDVVRPERLIAPVLADTQGPLAKAVRAARRIIVVGAGKAGAPMSAAVEAALSEERERLVGLVNVPADCVRPLERIVLHPARPAGSNLPTADGVEGARRMLELVESAGPEDVVVCLLSGGGSALLPAPVPDVPLTDKLDATRLLHASGATIAEMNAVRKHLSEVKGGRLAERCRAGQLFSLIISDVVGDPLDTIASGPTAPDPTTFADAVTVLKRYHLLDRVASTVRRHLEAGMAGHVPETAKQTGRHVHNWILGNNRMALEAASEAAAQLGYKVLNLGSWIEGETVPVATALAGIVRSITHDRVPLSPPVCILSGGETTVTLPVDSGTGGRNQEFALALLVHLGEEDLVKVVVLCGGSDGEDGPTDAAGAFADVDVLRQAAAQGLDPRVFLHRHDAYTFFAATGGLMKTGPTGTNVMDVRVVLVGNDP